MKVESMDLVDKGDEVVKAVEDLSDETDDLADLNDEPHLKQDDVEGIIATVIRVIVSVFKL